MTQDALLWVIITAAGEEGDGAAPARGGHPAPYHVPADPASPGHGQLSGVWLSQP